MQNSNWHPAVAAAQGREERPLRTNQAAVRLKCSERWVRRLCQDKILEGIKVGRRRWLIPPSAIDEYLDAVNQE